MDESTFIGKIDKNGVIWSKGVGTQNDIEVGLDNKAIMDMRKECDEIFNKAQKYLEELYATHDKSSGQYGRARPKTAEQISTEQKKVNDEIFSILQEMRTDLQALKNTNENKIKII